MKAIRDLEKSENNLVPEVSNMELRNIKASTLYKPEYAEKLKTHLQKDSFPKFSSVVGQAEWVLYVWLRCFPEFKQAREQSQPMRIRSPYWIQQKIR